MGRPELGRHLPWKVMSKTVELTIGLWNCYLKRLSKGKKLSHIASQSMCLKFTMSKSETYLLTLLHRKSTSVISSLTKTGMTTIYFLVVLNIINSWRTTYDILFWIIRLEVRQASEGIHHVPGIVDAKVESINDAWNILQAGSNARVVGSNNVNEHSSRSHWLVWTYLSVDSFNFTFRLPKLFKIK